MLLTEMLPPPVATEERFGDVRRPTLHPEEAAVVAGAIDARRREFATTRTCAHLALARVGAPPGPILPQGDVGPRWARGAPLWPPGLVGSMTHCTGYRAAAVGRASDIASIGIDAEPHRDLPPAVARAILRPEERDILARALAARPDVSWCRLVFSAKESVFKAWYPLTHRWLGFGDCRIEIGIDDGTFRAHLLVPPGDGPERLRGRWRISAPSRATARPGLIATAVVVGHPRSR